MMYLARVRSNDDDSQDDSQDDVEAINDAFAQVTLLMSRYLFDRSDLSPTASAVLYRLHAEGPVRLTTLASSVEISQPSMTQLVQRLERRDLVARSTDPGDRRAALVSITEVGRRLVLARQDGVRERLRESLALLPSGQRDALRLAAHVALPIVESLIDIELS